MMIYCVNWQAADEAELERTHYPDSEFVLARSTINVAASLDPELAKAWRNGETWIKDGQLIAPWAAFYRPASMSGQRANSLEVKHTHVTEGRLANCANDEYLK